MKVKLKVEKEFDVIYLQAEVGVRYWEDSKVNGVEDEHGDLIPCRDGKYWKPLIELESGRIINWKQGVSANIHYKSVDCNTFKLLDSDKDIIKEIEGYVIYMMCPVGNGFGDYVIMDIDENGFIQDWEVNFSEFEDDED